MEKHQPQAARLEAVRQVDLWAREQARLWKSP